MHKVLCFSALLTVAFSLPQEISFFKEENAGGDGIILRGKYDVLLPWQQDFILNSSSVCYVGLVRVYAYSSYLWTTFQPEATTTKICENAVSFGPEVWSTRYIGPEDTAIESLTVLAFARFPFYEGPEIVITSNAAADFGFFPETLLITGLSNWTLYFNDDFTGDSTCVRGYSEFQHIVSPNVPAFRSVLKGCDLSETEKESLVMEYYQDRQDLEEGH